MTKKMCKLRFLSRVVRVQNVKGISTDSYRGIHYYEPECRSLEIPSLTTTLSSRYLYTHHYYQAVYHARDHLCTSQAADFDSGRQYGLFASSRRHHSVRVSTDIDHYKAPIRARVSVLTHPHLHLGLGLSLSLTTHALLLR